MISNGHSNCQVILNPLPWKINAERRDHNTSRNQGNIKFCFYPLHITLIAKYASDSACHPPRKALNRLITFPTERLACQHPWSPRGREPFPPRSGSGIQARLAPATRWNKHLNGLARLSMLKQSYIILWHTMYIRWMERRASNPCARVRLRLEIIIKYVVRALFWFTMCITII